MACIICNLNSATSSVAQVGAGYLTSVRTVTPRTGALNDPCFCATSREWAGTGGCREGWSGTTLETFQSLKLEFIISARSASR
eukprot:1448363-Rhodomonas_salina.1